MVFQPLSGFRDFLPEACEQREWLFAAWRRVAARFGFRPYDGPPLEPLDLYKAKSGGEIVGQLYNFVDKGNREVALRPEMTPTLARIAAAHQREFKKPMKWFAIPQLFRFERAQRGRLREHFQWNADILGEPGFGAEVELILLLVASFREVGLGPEDLEIRLSDRLFWMDFLKGHGVPEDRHYEFFQAIDKIGRQDEAVTRERLGALADPVFDVLAHGGKSERFDELIDWIGAAGVGDWVRVDVSIVRGLAYYTGMVFEVHDRAGQFRAVAGGGRYDHLLELIGGVQMPAVGFGMGDVVLTELLREKGRLPCASTPVEYYVVVADEKWRKAAIGLVEGLRRQGLRVDYPLAPLKVGRQFQMASDLGARWAVVVDEAWERGKVALKNLETRQQHEIALERTADGGFRLSLPPQA